MNILSEKGHHQITKRVWINNLPHRPPTSLSSDIFILRQNQLKMKTSNKVVVVHRTIFVSGGSTMDLLPLMVCFVDDCLLHPMAMDDDKHPSQKQREPPINTILPFPSPLHLLIIISSGYHYLGNKAETKNMCFFPFSSHQSMLFLRSTNKS